MRAQGQGPPSATGDTVGVGVRGLAQESDLDMRAAAPGAQGIAGLRPRDGDMPRRLSYFSLGLAFSIGATALLGWIIPALGTHLPSGFMQMKANGALGVVLVAASLALDRVRSPWAHYLSRGFAAVTFLIGAGAVIEYVGGRHFILDTFLAADPGSSEPGLIAPGSAWGFALLGIMCFLRSFRRGVLVRIAPLTVLVTITYVILMLAILFFGRDEFLGVPRHVTVSYEMLLCLTLIMLSELRPMAGYFPFSLLLGTAAGSRLARVVLPSFLLFMVACAGARRFTVDAGFMSSEVANSIWLLVFLLAMGTSILIIATRANQLDNILSQSRQREAHNLRYRELLEQIMEGIVVRKSTGEVVFVNEAFCTMVGYSEAELLKMKVQDLVNLDDLAGAGEAGRLASKDGVHFDQRVRHADGSTIFVDVSMRRQPSGNMQLTVHDVTQRKRAEKARDESERRYMELVEQAADSIWVSRPDGRLVLVNDACCRLLGYSRRELLAKTTQQLLDPSDAEAISYDESISAGEFVWIERKLLHRDGYAIPVESSLRRLSDGDVQVVSRDVTDGKNEEERLLAMINGGATAMLMIAEDGQVRMANLQSERLFCYTQAELLGMNIKTLILARDSAAGTGAFFWMNPRTPDQHPEFSALRKDGAESPIEATFSAVTTREGRFVLTTVIDISERKRAEERVLAMIDGSPSAMVMVDEDGQIRHVNPQAEMMFAYGKGELIGKPIEILVPLEHRAGHPQLRGAYVAKPQVRSIGVGRDLRAIRKDGGEVPVEIGLNPIAIREKRYVLASIIDISARKRAEALERERAEDLKLLSQRIIQAQDSERRMLAQELHDEFGQSLTAILINLKNLEIATADNELRLRLVKTSDIAAQLLKEARQLSMHLHPAVLDEMGLEAAMQWCVRTRFAEEFTRIELQLMPDIPRLSMLVETTAYRVFQEALSNAVRHSGAAHVVVSMALGEGRLRFTVRDDGRGFDTEQALRAGKAGKSLGLTTMQERVQLANGTMAIRSESGRGTEVSVTIPTGG